MMSEREAASQLYAELRKMRGVEICFHRRMTKQRVRAS